MTDLQCHFSDGADRAVWQPCWLAWENLQQAILQAQGEPAYLQAKTGNLSLLAQAVAIAGGCAVQDFQTLNSSVRGKSADGWQGRLDLWLSVGRQIHAVQASQQWLDWRRQDKQHIIRHELQDLQQTLQKMSLPPRWQPAGLLIIPWFSRRKEGDAALTDEQCRQLHEELCQLAAVSVVSYFPAATRRLCSSEGERWLPGCSLIWQNLPPAPQPLS